MYFANCSRSLVSTASGPSSSVDLQPASDTSVRLTPREKAVKVTDANRRDVDRISHCVVVNSNLKINVL